MYEISLDCFKRCTKCKCWKLAAKSFFTKHSTGVFGLRSTCKVCQRCERRDTRAITAERDRRYRENNKEKIADHKKVYREKNKELIAEKKRRYREANIKRLNEKSHQYYQENREVFAERNRLYREENKEAIAERHRQYYRENREKMRAYYERWRKNNRDATRVHDRKRQAAKKGDSGLRDVNELWDLYYSQDGLCAYCETPLFGDFHIDHMQPLSRNGADNWSNYAITCPPCNQRKHAKTAEEFMTILRSVA